MAAVDHRHAPAAPFGAITVFRLVSAVEAAVLRLADAWATARVQARVARMSRRRRAALGLPSGAEALDRQTLESLLAPGRD